ncbi:MAG TPA: isoprenoid biosynthesis glyoxalase ElbB [Planctomycetia bacterium]|jgi:enhancing lycopene biosynthesis protein 2|nr:isoprenoid biosynthesis glyoxalase ElbB [Planctomycetia bacterium]
MPRVGVILSGCGVQDGSEIHEAVLTLLALDEAGAAVACLAPDRKQTLVVNHRTGKPVEETRSVIVESARIARGRIQRLADVGADDFDAVILPGGFGAALNLCDFGQVYDKCKVDPEVERLLLEMNAAGKPIGAWCIAPAVVAAVFRNKGVQLTIGDDADTAAALKRMGADHVCAGVGEVVVDAARKIVTTPAYMLAKSIKELRPGIEKGVAEVLKLTGAR